MKALFTLLVLFLLAGTNTVFAQYPSTTQMISDVKKSDPNAFVTVKTVGQWTMFHDKAPEWNDPDACKILVSISGSKKPDGTWWSYKGFAIYNKVGGKMVFDRVFLAYETTLEGIDLPNNEYFMNDFIAKMNERDPLITKGFLGLLDATNFYSYELVADPRATGTSNQIIVYATIKVVFDVVASNTKLEKRSSNVSMKYEMQGKDLKFLFAMRTQEMEFLDQTDFGDKAIVDGIPTFESSGKTIQEMTSQNPNYPRAKGSNGDGLPMDEELIELAKETFLTKADNFKLLFSEKGLGMITEVEFKTIDGRSAVVIDETHFDKALVCDYTFFNADDDAKKLTEYVSRFEISFSYEKDGENWSITNLKILTDREVIKNISLNYNSYINTVRSKTFGKKFGVE